jgi:predicted TIM-barrel fold metal-dependent hydrolase
MMTTQQAGSARQKAVDIVCNLFTESEVALRGSAVGPEFLAKVRLAAGRRSGVSVEDMLAMLDEADVDLAFLPATKAGSYRLRDSWHVPYERIAEVCAQHPERLRGLAGIDPTMGMAGVRELERGVRDLGFIGAHLYPHWFELAPDHARYYPFYAKCCELGVPVMMQVGHCLKYGEGHTLPSVGRPICLDQVACDFPELTIIGIHIGYPWTEEMISVAYKHPNVYIGSDAYAPRYWPEAFKHYVASWGQDKVMFGTDFPVIDPVRARREIDELGFPAAAQAKFLRGNALRVFGLSDGDGDGDAEAGADAGPGAESGLV